MTKTYESLPTLTVSENNTYSHPPRRPELVYMSDPATDVMINFETARPFTVSPRNTLDEANLSLKSSNSHIILVVEGEQVVGVVSSEDILGERPMRIVQERRIKREEILVRAVMTPIDKLMAIDYEELTHTKVGHVVNTLIQNKQHYMLVVDIEESSNEQRVHGLLYIYDIVKRLDKDLPSELREAGSLLELQHKLR